MAQGLFIVGFTVAEVVLIQSAAKEMLMEGKTLMSWADGNSNATRQFAMPVKEVLAVRPGEPVRKFVCGSQPEKKENDPEKDKKKR